MVHTDADRLVESIPPTTIELDLKGQVCPGPTVDTLMALKSLPPGGKVIVTTDYLPARQTIRDLAESRGHSFAIVEDDGTTFRIEIIKEGS
jgi:TusA-related sulfurtransferase